MSDSKEMKSRLMAQSPFFSYLPEGDRYLFKKEKPKYKFNVIGTGLVGQEHINVTYLEGRAGVHGVFDPNPGSIEGAKKLFSLRAPGETLKVYDSLEAACTDPEADGLIICTPNYTHIDVVKTALKSGKHILLEKPMATTLADAYEITKLAAEYKPVFQIGLQYRFKAVYVEAIHEALVRRAIGDIKTINIMEHRMPFLDKVGQWNKFAKYSGGTLIEKCCHYFDLMNLFAGSKPKTVFATGSMAVNFKQFEYGGQKSDILDNANVTVVYENGVQAGFNLCMFAPMYYEEMVLCGDEGRLKVFENETFIPGQGAKNQLEIVRGEDQPSRISNPSYPKHIESSGHNGGTFIEHIQFIESIEGRPTTAATVDDGFWSVVIGAAADESIKTGQPVNVFNKAGADIIS